MSYVFLTFRELLSDRVRTETLRRKHQRWLRVFLRAGFPPRCLRKGAVIDHSDDSNLPMGEGGREGVMRRGRGQEKEPNETNDDYRMVNTPVGAEPAVRDVV